MALQRRSPHLLAQQAYGDNADQHTIMTQLSSTHTIQSWREARSKDAGTLFVNALLVALCAACLLDVVTHVTAGGALFGVYTLKQAVAALGLLITLAILTRVLVAPAGGSWTRAAVAFVQQRAWLGVPACLGFVALLGWMFTQAWWGNFPLTQVCVFAAAVLLLGLVLFAPHSGALRWRKWPIGVLAFWLLIELGMQIAALLGVLPFDNRSGLYTAYGRVYQRGEGVGHGVTNRFGFYDAAPVAPGGAQGARARGIVLLGDGFVQGLHVSQREHMATQLRARIGASDRVSANGFPGYGAGLYTDPKLVPYTVLRFNPDEVVVLFHLVNDFDMRSEPDGVRPFYDLSADGRPVVRESDALRLHALQHLIIRAYDPLNPAQTLQSHLFTVQLLRQKLDPAYEYRDYGDLGVPPDYPTHLDAIGAGQPFGPASALFSANPTPAAQRAMTLAEAQLRTLQSELAALGIKLRVVTIPYFPPQLLERANAPGWSTESNGFDALRPERELQRFAMASGIDLLPMGEYMRKQNMTGAQIRAMYFHGGVGDLTPAGHAFFAQAIADCMVRAGGCGPW